MKDGSITRSIVHVAFAGAALAVAPPLGAQTAQGGQDSLRVRAGAGSTLDAKVEAIAREITSQRRIQQELGLSLFRLINQGDQVDEKEVAEVREQLRLATTRVSTLRQRLESVCSSDAKPRGWLGVTLQGQLTVAQQGNGPAVYMYGQHPRVESVEPGSPAEKAGLVSGDVIVALGGRDIRTDEVIPTELLRPGVRVPVRVLRSNGEHKVILVRIEPRPDGFADAPCPWIDANVVAAMAPPPPAMAYTLVLPDSARRVFLREGPSTPRPAAAAAPRVEAGAIIARPTPAPVPVPAPTPEAGFVFESNTVAGAQVMPMNDDLGANFGVDDGLLVLKVAPGTPASSAGLKSGDVLISANDHPLNSVMAFRREFSLSSDRTLKLQIVRRHEKQTILLRWSN